MWNELKAMFVNEEYIMEPVRIFGVQVRYTLVPVADNALWGIDDEGSLRTNRVRKRGGADRSCHYD